MVRLQSFDRDRDKVSDSRMTVLDAGTKNLLHFTIFVFFFTADFPEEGQVTEL